MAELEKRVRELEAGTTSKGHGDLQAFWKKASAAPDVETLVEEFRVVMSKSTPLPGRPQIHGLMDQLVAGPGDPRASPALTTILISSEPCGMFIATVITLTICDK